MQTAEDYYYKVILPRVRKAIVEFKEEIGIWGKADRWFYLLNELFETQSEITQIFLDYARQARNNEAYIDRAIPAFRLPVLESRQERLLREIISVEKSMKGEMKRDGITPGMIQQAREYPISNFIDVRRGMALCPFHADKNPSMGIKHNRYHCFACGAKGDVIDFLMKRDGLNFIDVVKQLQ